MKLVKLIVSAFMLIFAVFGILGVISFDAVVPVVVICTAFVTYIDAKRLAAENRENEARSMMNAVIFMIALAMFWFFMKKL